MTADTRPSGSRVQGHLPSDSGKNESGGRIQLPYNNINVVAKNLIMVYGIRDLLCPMHDCGMVPVTQHLSNALE